MATIAIIGQDGAGKTTVSNMIMEQIPLDLKYIYMGRNVQSSNFTLPTSKIIHAFKVNNYIKTHNLSKSEKDKKLSLHELDKNRKVDKRGKIGATLRLLNRLFEEWYRLLISKYFQLKGKVILYDRHFIFDYAPDVFDASKGKERLTTKIHGWALNNLYEKPDLVLFLHAPAEVLFARKGEATLEYLNARNEAFLNAGKGMPNFVIIDATQPLEEVFSDVTLEIDKLTQSKNLKITNKVKIND
jgi:thymidylate kinase